MAGFLGPAKNFTGKGLDQLASLPVLRNISFAGTGFNGDAAKMLEILNLENTAVTADGVAALGGLTALRDLKLNGCEKLDGSFLKSWPVMRALRSLDLSRLTFAEGEDFDALARQTGLTRLDLTYQPTFDDARLSRLAPLVRMKEFSASSTLITGSGFREFKGWTAMEELSLANARVTAEGMAALAAAFPTLDYLNLGYSLKVEPADFRHLAGMKKLGRLIVHSVVNDAALAEIARIPGLGNLSIENSPITHEGLAALQDAKVLTKLNLSRCEGLDDRAIPVLKNSPFPERTQSQRNRHLQGDRGRIEKGHADLRDQVNRLDPR